MSSHYRGEHSPDTFLIHLTYFSKSLLTLGRIEIGLNAVGSRQTDNFL